MEQFCSIVGCGTVLSCDLIRAGRYTAREAAIIATGFSTVSMTFLLVVARTLGLMDLWTTYFFVSMFVTFIVTALTARIWPFSAIPDTYFTGEKATVPKEEGSRLERAWKLGLETAAAQPPVLKLCTDNLMSGLKMAFGVIPSITSIGLLGLFLAEFTPIFDYFGYLFVPFFKLFGVSQAVLAGHPHQGVGNHAFEVHHRCGQHFRNPFLLGQHPLYHGDGYSAQDAGHRHHLVRTGGLFHHYHDLHCHVLGAA